MKSILLLCLFAMLSCNIKDVIKTASCIVKNEKAAKVIIEIFEHIKRKQYSLIPKLLLNDFSELKKVTEKCLKSEELDEVSLQIDGDFVEKSCLLSCKPFNNKICIDSCTKKYKK